MYGGQPFRSKREQWKRASPQGQAHGSGREHVPDSFSKDLKFASTVPAGRLEPWRNEGTCIQSASIIFVGFPYGAVAQLGERLICIQEVAGSIPTSSTSY